MRQKPLDKKFCTGSQVSWTKKWIEIMDKAVPETAKKVTKFGIKLFNGTYPLSFP